jgi:hypothetical protein
VKAIPKTVLTSKTGSIEMRSNTITIGGTIEGAALALAEDVLKQLPKNRVWYDGATYATKTYVGSIQAIYYKDSGQYNLVLLNLEALDPDKWATLKKSTEKICNDLTAFM